jgi:hypothetical protein
MIFDGGHLVEALPAGAGLLFAWDASEEGAADCGGVAELLAFEPVGAGLQSTRAPVFLCGRRFAGAGFSGCVCAGVDVKGGWSDCGADGPFAALV